MWFAVCLVLFWVSLICVVWILMMVADFAVL